MEFIKVTLYSHIVPTDVTEYTWYPIFGANDVRCGTIYSWKISVNRDATRMGLHLMYPHAAVEIEKHVSIVDVNHAGRVIANSLTCYFIYSTNHVASVAAILVLNNDIVPHRKISSIGYRKEETTDRTNVSWHSIPEVKATLSGWRLGGVDAIHDPRFGVVDDNGPPYKITANEINGAWTMYNHKEHNARLAEIAAKTAEIEALGNKNRKLTERLAKMTMVAAELMSAAEVTAANDDSSA